jgi:hypothetical protein
VTEPTPDAVPQGVKTLPASRAGARPTDAEITAAVTDFVAHNSAGVVVEEVTDVKVARDGGGRWWVSVWAVPTDPSRFEGAIVYLYKDGARWHLFDLGTGIDSSELPKSVRRKL